MLWVALAPWIWGFADSHSAVANHIFFTFAFGPLALMIAVLRPAAIVALGGGIWLALSPWVLGYASNDVAWLNELVSGGLMIMLCANAAGLGALMRSRRRAPGRTATTSSGAVKTVSSRS
jgi:SPW repeat